MKRRVISAVLAVVIALSAIFCLNISTAYADDSGNCGASKTPLGAAQNNATYTYNATTKTLTISGTGATKNYGDTSANSRPWDSYKSEITTVVVNEGITELGYLNFYNFTALTSVSLPSSLLTISGSTANYGAFRGCNALRNITLPEGLTTIGAMAFRDCTALTSIRFPNSLTTLGDSAFRGCTSLISVTYGNGMTSTGAYAFYDCTNLNNVSFSPTITKIDSYSFFNTRFTEVEIPDTITSIGTRSFANCSFLYKVTVNNANCTFEGISVSIEGVGQDPFNGSSQTLTFYGHTGSTTETYANEKGYQFVSLDDCAHINKSTSIARYPTCTENGLEQVICDDCGWIVSETDIAAVGHAWRLVDTEDFTKETGHILKYYECTNEGCGSEQVVISHEAFIEGYYTTETEGNCTVGYEKKICTVEGCGKVERNLVTNNHQVENYVVTLQPTCTEEGSKQGVCSVCGETVTTAIPAKGHTLVLVEEIDATEDNGHIYYVKECDVCHEEIIEYNHVDLDNQEDGDTWMKDYYESEVILQERCTVSGVRQDTCTICGKTRLVEIPANGEHEWYENEDLRKEPTCTQDGKIYYNCRNCDMSKSENIPALGHNYVLQEESCVEPTCTDAGYNVNKCSVCGMSSTTVIPAKGHTINGATYTVISEPTCETDGSAHSTCAVCGVEYDMVLPLLGHDMEDVITEIPDKPGHSLSTPTCTRCGQTDIATTVHNEWIEGHYTVETKQATCTSIGYVKTTCEYCQLTNTEYSAMTGHSYKYTVTRNDGTLVYACTNCGVEQSYSSKYVAGLFPTYINTAPSDKTLGYLFELKDDGIINAKDYALINKATASVSTVE